MLNLQCDICQETFSIEKFLFESCGHGFCESCTERTLSSKNCPICRKGKSKVAPHRIYYTPADPSTEEQAQSVAHAMNSLGSNSSPDSTVRIGVNLRKISKELDGKTARRLLEVAKNMDERLYPLFHQLQLEHDEKRAMQDKFNAWLPRVKRTEIAESEADRLKEEVSRLQRQLECARVRLDDEKRENAKLRCELADQRRSTEEKVREVRYLKSRKENSEREARLAKKKLRAMGSASKPLSLQKDADGDSLIVL